MPNLPCPTPLSLRAAARVIATQLLAALAAATLVALCADPACAATGLTQLPPPQDGDRPVTVFYPTDATPQPVQRGRFSFQLAPDAAPAAGNGRLVVISHGSGGAPWVHADLAQALVAAGYTVAVPWHRGDSAGDDGEPGPVSWARRPAEVSRAIDAVAAATTADGRLAPLQLKLDRVGVYGMSAGGHTALSLAGGRWSPGRFRQHCEAHIADDFAACVGLITRPSSGWWGEFKRWVALQVIRARFDDDAPLSHSDPRVAAVVAAVPFAADFELASLAQPRVPLALLSARRDAWLAPRFHADAVLAACAPRCTALADLAEGGHGAYLSPLPPGLSGRVGELLADPPGFDRAALATVDQQVVAWFNQQLRDGR